MTGFPQEMQGWARIKEWKVQGDKVQRSLGAVENSVGKPKKSVH